MKSKLDIPYLSASVMVIVLSLMILAGCSTTNKTSKSAQEIAPSVSDEAPKEVKLTEYILGPGDKIEILVYRHDDLKMITQIDPSGKITYPLLGDITVSGLSIFQLRDTIRTGLSYYVVDPQVSVSVLGVQSQKVYVIGEVTRPGVFSLDIPKSVLEAISSAGGFTQDAKDESVILIRGDKEKPRLIKLDIESALEDGNISQNIQLQKGDIVYVPSTFIADVSRFSQYLTNILRPILIFEQGVILGPKVEAALEGGQDRQTNIIIDTD
jgi:polysaccharide export outer membrane protein